MSDAQKLDAIVVGGGVNGLVAALVLRRSGLSVRVLEGKPAVGGMTRAEFPFPRAPKLPAQTGAHRIGILSPALMRLLGVSIPTRPRDPCTFTPTRRGVFLAGPGNAAFRAAAASVAPQDAAALDRFHTELDAILADLEPAWVSGPMGVEETADRYLRPALREPFLALCRGSAAAAFDRAGIQSELVRAILAADALSGTWAGPFDPGSATPLLLRHLARSAEGGCEAVPDGGLSAVVRILTDAAIAAGVQIETGKDAAQIVVEGNAVAGVRFADGSTLAAETILASADPSRLRAMVGAEKLTPEYIARIDGFTKRGSIAKVNLALAALPRFAALPEDLGQHRAVTYLLPDADGTPMQALARAFAEADRGLLPGAPPIECTFPTTDADGRVSASLVVGWTPYDLEGSTWAAEEERFTARVIAALDAFAPGAASLVVDASVLHPKKLETHFGVTRGHPYHIDDAFLFGERLPYTTPIGGLYACGASCAPAGAVFGAAGYNAAMRVLGDLEMALERTDVTNVT